ncbi:hypothetical protein ABZX93_34375 [Streptomyces sp. NPDC006632]|uniref:hypothetical protein n=1 Tax=Streptomyces sp. NPDC006632 TaxID=3157182 RepID=UPI0033B17CE1
MGSNLSTAEQLTAALRAGEVISAELTAAAIARFERDDDAINAICVPDFDRARAAARGADQARARGEDRPLLGKTNVPVGLQDIPRAAGEPPVCPPPPYRRAGRPKVCPCECSSSVR